MNFSFPLPWPEPPWRPLVFSLSPAEHRALARLLRRNPKHPKAYLAPRHEALGRTIEKHLGPGGAGRIAPGSHRRFERCKRVIEGWTAAG